MWPHPCPICDSDWDKLHMMVSRKLVRRCLCPLCYECLLKAAVLWLLCGPNQADKHAGSLLYSGNPSGESAEETANLSFTKSEDLLHIRFDLDLIGKLPQRAERKRKIDCVRNQRPAISRLKTMLVPPQLVRAAQLEIDKSVGRLPFHNFTGPAQRDAMHAQAVIDQRSLLDRLGLDVKNLEVQPRRSKRFQVLCSGEKVENLG